ncbi:hypothetical protein [Aquimarina sp. I32.4]|uniref:hypothetical protein n=1 Tax=Aquimarina sp. I32.4 TaxID=2053903 RepID=UPI000CDF0092|nr:hypothetical protein [Aquimarina sp. I32.4]
MSALKSKAIFTIQKGKLENFKDIATQCINCVKQKDKSTLKYDWYFSDNLCIVDEEFSDSEAMLSHMQNLGKLPLNLTKIATFNLEIYGSPTSKLMNALKALNPTVFNFYKGL